MSAPGGVGDVVRSQVSLSGTAPSLLGSSTAPSFLVSSSSSSLVVAKSPKRQYAPDDKKLIPFLFKKMILQLDEDMKEGGVWTAGEGDRKMVVKKATPVILQSLFYDRMVGVRERAVSMQQDQLLYTILELNEYAKANPAANLAPIRNSIVLCMRHLLREEGWKAQDITRFFQKFYTLHNAIYAGWLDSPSLLLVDQSHATKYLSDKSQEFMDTVMVGDLQKILELVKEEARQSSFTLSDTTLKKVGKVAYNFLDSKEKISYLAMSKGFDRFPGATLVDAIAGMAEFREATIATKYIYMRMFRDRMLDCFSSDPKKVVHEEVTCGSGKYVVSFALHKEKDGPKRVKSIAYSRATDESAGLDSIDESDNDNIDRHACLFVDELKEETPEALPDPTRSCADLPLYGVELVPSSHAVCLEKVPFELRDAIVKKITEEQWDICRHTAIWHDKELKLVSIDWEIGNMLCRSALVGEYLTFIGRLDPEKYDAVFTTRLKQVYMGAYVLTIDEFLSTWYRDALFKGPANRTNYPEITLKVKQAAWDYFHEHDDPFKWLKKSILTVGHPAGNKIKYFKETEEEKTALRALNIVKDVEILKDAWKDDKPIPILLSLVKMMVSGIENILNHCKENEAISVLDLCFQPFEGFPLASIPKIVTSRSTVRQKASSLLTTLFALKSLELPNSPRKQRAIQGYLEGK